MGVGFGVLGTTRVGGVIVRGGGVHGKIWDFFFRGGAGPRENRGFFFAVHLKISRENLCFKIASFSSEKGYGIGILCNR